MADVLTLGQQQLTVLHYQVQYRSVALPRITSFKLGQPTLDSALKQGKESSLLLLSLLYQSSMRAPLSLVTTVTVGDF